MTEHPPAPLCPICRRPTAAQYRPFCSLRCAQVDLGRWFGEVYRVPTQEPAGGDEEREEGG